jgi:SAM-dependent methyltransferase
MEPSAESYCFDRAADYYDETRSLDPALMQKVIDFLTDELAERETVLEIGVGTGRIALPLAEREVPMIGSDLSTTMMARLVEKAGGASPFPLMRADATCLPLQSDSIDAVIACWVLHLIPRWTDAIEEVARVLRLDGIFLVNQGGWHNDWFDDVEGRFAEAAGIPKRLPGLMTKEELDSAMEELGAMVRVPDPITGTQQNTIAARLDRLEQGMYSWTWGIPQETRSNAVEQVRAWARDEYGDLDEPRDFETAESWRVYEL